MSTWPDLKNNPRLKQIFETRSEIVRLTREFFWSRGFKEAETPIALRLPSQEPYLNFFPVTVTHPRGDEHKFYLRTSPEYALKKLLAAGYSKLFEIGKCFRNNEDFGGTHNPEFTMIEWYRAPGSTQDFMDDMESLFKYVGDKLETKIVRLKDCKVDISEQWDRMSMKGAWKKFSGIDLDNNLTIEQLNNTAREKEYSVDQTYTYEDTFFKIFLNEIEPHLGLERPVFIYDYPAPMASLSRLCVHDPRYAERVECYIGGLELANGFGELLDAPEQKRRLEADKALRAKLGKETWEIDEDFIAGLPAIAERSEATAGVALGLDRMVLLFTGAKDINEVIFGSAKDQLPAE